MYKLYPRVFKSNKKQTIYVQTEPAVQTVEIRVQGMEYYTIPHSAVYRIDEETRYPYLPMKRQKDGLFVCEYEFAQEQKYSVKVRIGGATCPQTYIYAVDEDLAALKPFKGDTHLHSNRSDGEGTPFEVSCAYRKAAYDFIVLTDHHKYAPSIEGRDALKRLTDEFIVFKGEEVHNRDMGYFHIINFGGEESVNVPILANPDEIEKKVQAIIESRDFTGANDVYNCAYRIFIAEEIRKCGGLAVMAHPYWDCFGEYNAQVADVRYLWRKGCYDALELLAGCDIEGNNGNNLQVALWGDLRAEGIKVPVVGASDSHSCTRSDSKFNQQFTIVFAKDEQDIIPAIKAERSVAVDRRSDDDYFVFGNYRYVNYARYLLEFYSPEFKDLAYFHGEALLQSGGERTEEIARTEADIAAFKKEFFAF